jgi:hypothetical protein
MKSGETSEYEQSGEPLSDSYDSGDDPPESSKQELVEKKLEAMKKPPRCVFRFFRKCWAKQCRSQSTQNEVRERSYKSIVGSIIWQGGNSLKL